jgi:hypothetical protein
LGRAGLVSVSSAGTTVSEQSKPNTTPMPLKMPKARTGASGESPNDRNPTPVVSDVLTTGHTIVSNVSRTT